ncbi:hypothetical protein LTR53_006746 [Teratosphaeriaceae sp. CCFEE 6253]|nr:hypothetical protein LTR53_006746 [Teratosphaeriaceae sp. CCFEE 6253]
MDTAPPPPPPPPDMAAKRKRSPSESAPPPSAPPAKVSKTSTSNALSINYLARHTQDDLPLLNKEDTIPNLLQLLSAYNNVLDRHESLASNLGARPLGPILIKRFERCFDAPPNVVASHHKGATAVAEDVGRQITWLEVIEFARSHPSQFTLSTFSEGKRVCQFYYPQKQLRVQISEEDFLFINSGRCQELIPPLPIWEDEEKEVGTCDVLETKLKELTNLADMVAARTRQLSHRLKGRRAAIIERRADGGSGTPAKIGAQQTTTAPPSSGGGFLAVNAGHEKAVGEFDTSGSSFAAVRTELLKHFESLPQNHGNPRPHSRHHSTTHGDHAVQPGPKPVEPMQTFEGASDNSSLSPVPTNLAVDPLSYYVSDSTPAPAASQNHTSNHHRPSISTGGGHAYGASSSSSKHNFSRPLPPALESSQPFRPLCQAHMDGLPRGHRVMPPCDRCRRLRMDCVKNLTSCAGCTKKHARCHWREVSREELGDLDHLMDTVDNGGGSYAAEGANGYANGLAVEDYQSESDDDDSNPLEDLEALGEKEEQREKELAERAKEDEDGLRNAKELARQGREVGTYTVPEQRPESSVTDAAVDSIQVPALQPLGAETPNGEVAKSTEPHYITPSAAQPSVDSSNAAETVNGTHLSAPAVQDASSTIPSFVPLPAAAPSAMLPSPYSGFHAVNGNTAGADWRGT